jgi:hypothetical protein
MECSRQDIADSARHLEIDLHQTKLQPGAEDLVRYFENLVRKLGQYVSIGDSHAVNRVRCAIYRSIGDGQEERTRQHISYRMFQLVLRSAVDQALAEKVAVPGEISTRDASMNTGILAERNAIVDLLWREIKQRG